MAENASQVQLIPLSELALGQAGVIRNDVIRRTLLLAMTETKLAEAQLIVRDIRAKDDLALYSKGSDADVEDWGCVTGTTADAYETMSTGTNVDQRWIALYGVKADGVANACSALKFEIGGGLRAIWQLQSLRPEDDMVGLCPSGLIIPPNAPYTISRYVRQASASAFIVLKGVVVEPRGLVLSP